jgi:hypothetical protein
MTMIDADRTIPPPPYDAARPDLYERARIAATPEARAAARAAEAPTLREIARRHREDAIATVRPPPMREPRMAELYVAVLTGE